MDSNKKQSVAIIGGGVSGISACLLLQNNYNIDLYEKENYIGGHTNTIELTDSDNKPVAVDTGFIVCNDWTYPNFHAMLKKLSVPIRDACMSFGYHDETTGFQYSGTSLNGLFADRKNIISPKMLGLIWNVYKFNKKAKLDLKNNRDLEGITLKQYLEEIKVSETFILQYLVPIGGAIWSSSNAEMLDFPAELFLHFFKNHGLLNVVNKPQWQTVQGGSFSYVKKFLTQFKGNVILNSGIDQITRSSGKVSVQSKNGTKQYDKIIFATHADQITPILKDADEVEIDTFRPWKYIENHTILHTDKKVMPSNRRAWASWNFTKEPQTVDSFPVSVTYDMNRLQGLTSRDEYFVTLNRNQQLDPLKIIREFKYLHPNFEIDTLKSQKKIWKLNGHNNTYYTGSYMGYGFHEDAVKSSVDLVDSFFEGEMFT